MRLSLQAGLLAVLAVLVTAARAERVTFDSSGRILGY